MDPGGAGMFCPKHAWLCAPAALPHGAKLSPASSGRWVVALAYMLMSDPRWQAQCGMFVITAGKELICTMPVGTEIRGKE